MRILFLALASLGAALIGGSASSEPLHATVTLDVSGDATYTIPHKIVIAATPGLVHSRDELERRDWVAVRTSERGENSINSSDCPALRSAALAFGDLPPLAPSSVLAFRIAENGTLSFPPTMMDGFPAKIFWTAEDGTRVETVGGYWHRLWAHETISALIGCWGPLIPEGSSMPGRP
jgi:hypothetical protein